MPRCSTTLSSTVVAELTSGNTTNGPGSLVASLSLVAGQTNTFAPNETVVLSPSTTYYFSLGYPFQNANITDWFFADTDLSSDGPATMEQAWVSSSQGATWATGGSFLRDSRFLFEVVPEPAPNSSAGAAFAVLAALRARRRRRP
jgi:MYXO-CTERM domain-containing protein